PQVQLADAVLVDLSSLQIVGEWILAWMRAHAAGMPVIVRAAPGHMGMADLSPNWSFFFKDDPIERVRQTIATYLAHRHLLQEVQFLKETATRRSQFAPASAPRPVPPADGGHQYREAFVNLSRWLGSSHDLKTLSEQALSLLR